MSTKQQLALLDLLWREALRRCDGDEVLAGVVLLDVLRECGLRLRWQG